MVAFYMVLFLIRPWEEMYPWMAVFPIERTFAILAIATVVLGGQFWFQLTGQTWPSWRFSGLSHYRPCSGSILPNLGIHYTNISPSLSGTSS